VRSIPSYSADACRKRDLVAPLTLFKALRMQMDELGMVPD
jgi:2-haloacid dehalogenase